MEGVGGSPIPPQVRQVNAALGLGFHGRDRLGGALPSPLSPGQVLRQGTFTFTGVHLRSHTPSGMPQPSSGWDHPGPSVSAWGQFSWPPAQRPQPEVLGLWPLPGSMGTLKAAPPSPIQHRCSGAAASLFSHCRSGEPKSGPSMDSREQGLREWVRLVHVLPLRDPAQPPGALREVNTRQPALEIQNVSFKTSSLSRLSETSASAGVGPCLRHCAGRESPAVGSGCCPCSALWRLGTLPAPEETSR